LGANEMQQEERVVLLHGAVVPVIKSGHDGMIYVSIPHLCEALGLDLDREETVLEARADLWWGHRELRVWTPPGHMKVGPCLRSDLVYKWLADAIERSPNPDKLGTFRDVVGDVARIVFDSKDLMSDMPPHAMLTNIVTFDEPPPPDIVEKLGRIVDSLGATGIASLESEARLKRLVAEAKRLNAQESTSANRKKIISEVDQLLGADPE
jgi:hypothetical protein